MQTSNQSLRHHLTSLLILILLFTVRSKIMIVLSTTTVQLINQISSRQKKNQISRTKIFQKSAYKIYISIAIENNIFVQQIFLENARWTCKAIFSNTYSPK